MKGVEEYLFQMGMGDLDSFVVRIDDVLMVVECLRNCAFFALHNHRTLMVMDDSRKMEVILDLEVEWIGDE